jgi:HPt (histidine-containing phosphotransfer) domain-containing protein
MLEMFGDFKESLPQRMAEIHAALEEGSPEALRKRAHNLKGVSLTFCANPVAKLAIKIEEAGKRGDMADMAGYVSQLDYEIKRLEEFISNALPH